MLDRNVIISCARYVAALLVSLNAGGEQPKKPDCVSYRAVFKFAKRHALAGALWYLLEDEITAFGDEELTARFSRECELDYLKNNVQTQEFASVCSAFGKAGIKHLPLKGFISKALWKRPEYRSMTDMDIYVSPSDTDAAAEILLSLGYAEDHKSAEHDSYIKPPYVNIELHKTLESYGIGDFSNWRAKENAPCFYELSDEDFLIFILMHMYKHYKAGGTGMRSFYDLHLFLGAKRGSLDLGYVRGELDKRGIGEFYSVALRLSELWFLGRTECADELADFEYYIATGGTFGTVENRVEHALTEKSRFRYTLSRIFLSYPKMKALYKWLGPLPFLLPVAWVIRLVAALFDGRLRRELRATSRAAKNESGEGEKL